MHHIADNQRREECLDYLLLYCRREGEMFLARKEYEGIHDAN